MTKKPSSPEEREQEFLADAFREVVSSPSGKRVLFWMLEQCAVYSDAYSGDNNATNYRLGLQSAGKRLIAQFDAIDPLIYPTLVMEMAKLRLEAKADAERSAATATEEDDDAAYV